MRQENRRTRQNVLNSFGNHALAKLSPLALSTSCRLTQISPNGRAPNPFGLRASYSLIHVITRPSRPALANILGINVPVTPYLLRAPRSFGVGLKLSRGGTSGKRA